MNNLKERIDADIKAAMISKDNVKKEILKFIKSEVQRKEGGLLVLSDIQIEKLMRGQVENLKITPSETSEEEIKVLEAYLPQMMTKEEIIKVILTISSNEDITLSLPFIMKHFSEHYKGKVDNKLVSETYKELESEFFTS